jgi:uncharacterized protein (TIGR03435 family)
MHTAKLQLALLALLTAATLAPAQAPAPAATDYVPTLTFDLASIRETEGVNAGGLRVGVNSPAHKSLFETTNFTIKGLIQIAYGFDMPLSGGPDWLTDRYYNIQAKSDAAVDAQMAKMTDEQSKLEKQHMIKVMLAERFNFKAHTEIKDSSVYVLSQAKGGSKLTPVKVDPEHPPVNNNQVQGSGGAQGLQLTSSSYSPTAMAAMLSTQLEAPVVDHTGLTGFYSFTLQIGRDWSASNPQGWPDILTAVQEQLGLKLERTRLPVPVLIIDHIDKPSAN